MLPLEKDEASALSEQAAAAPQQLNNEPIIEGAKGASSSSDRPQELRRRFQCSDFGLYERLELLTMNPRFTARCCIVGFSRNQVSITVEGREIVATYRNAHHMFKRRLFVPDVYDLNAIQCIWVTHNSLHILVPLADAVYVIQQID